MDSTITHVLLLLDERRKVFDLSTGASGAANNAVTIEISALKNKWEKQLREFDASIYGVAVFTGGRRFRSQM